MKLRKQAFASFVCSLALVSNSFGVLAQDKTPAQKQSGKVTIRTPDGQTKELTLDGSGSVFVDQNGQQIQIHQTLPEGTPGVRVGGRVGVGVGSGVGGATFFSQDGVLHTLPSQDFVFVNGQSVGGGQASTYSFVTSEMSFDSKLVKGAPFAADVENETVQTLADGNRIVRKSGGAIYRDSEGRTRRESTINAVGPLAGVDAARTITINDPVEGSGYSLEPHSRIARKHGFVRTAMPTMRATAGPGTAAAGGTATLTTTPKNIAISGSVLQANAVKKTQPAYPPIAKAAKASGAVQVQVTISEQGKVVDANVISGHPLLRDSALEAARQWEFKPTELGGAPVKVQGTLTFNFALSGEENKTANQEGAQALTFSRARMPKYETNEESLGKQIFDGVEAEGKRLTTTIPEGAIGNERAIQIVSETWYSPELQTVVLSKRNDPTSGETTFRLTNIRRGDPDASLFQVPSDYTVREGGGAGYGFTTAAPAGAVRMRSTKPENQ